MSPEREEALVVLILLGIALLLVALLKAGIL